MELLHSKIDTLHTLWSSLGSPVDVDTIRRKLQHVFYELDRVVEHEKFQKRLLSADIEDVTASIETACDILGISIDSVLSSSMCKEVGSDFNEIFPFLGPTFGRRAALVELNSRLADEIRQRRSRVKVWRDKIQQLSEELQLEHGLGAFEEDDNDLSWATVQTISCSMRDMNLVKRRRQDAFNQSANAIQFYWTAMKMVARPSDPIEYALSQLFSARPMIVEFNSLEIPPATYCNTTLPYPLRLTTNIIDELQAKAASLKEEYASRMDLYQRLLKGIHTLWEELEIPNDRRCEIQKSLDSAYLVELKAEYAKIRTIIQSMIDEYIDKFQERLEDLWDRCLLTVGEREKFRANLRDKADTMEEVRIIVDEHIQYLIRIQGQSKLVDGLMKERRSLIQDMVNFEAMASNPRRLFQASFQLLEEERWRNTRFPRLLQLDDDLIKAVKEFETVSRKHFLYEERRYLDILYEEIAARAANQTFFGFLNSASSSERTNRTRPPPPRCVPSASKSLQRATTNSPTPINTTQSRPRRAKSDAKLPPPNINPNASSGTANGQQTGKRTGSNSPLPSPRSRQRKNKPSTSPIASPQLTLTPQRRPSSSMARVPPTPPASENNSNSPLATNRTSKPSSKIPVLSGHAVSQHS